MDYKKIKNHIVSIFIILLCFDNKKKNNIFRIIGGAKAATNNSNNSSQSNNSGNEDEEEEEEKDHLSKTNEIFEVFLVYVKNAYDYVAAFFLYILSHILIGSVFPAVPFLLVMGGMSTFFKLIIDKLNNL